MNNAVNEVAKDFAEILQKKFDAARRSGILPETFSDALVARICVGLAAKEFRMLYKPYHKFQKELEKRI